MKRTLNIIVTAAIFVLLLTVSSPALAGKPTDQLKGTIDRLLVILQDDSLKGDENKGARRTALSKAVSKRFSFREMSRRSLGKHWKIISDEDKQAFIEAFKNLIQNSYFTKMELYTDEEIIYDNERMLGKTTIIKTLVVTSSGTEIPIDYRLKLNKRGQWLVYDIVVEGISLVRNYRSSFAAELKKGSIGDLIKQLEAKSAK